MKRAQREAQRERKRMLRTRKKTLVVATVLVLCVCGILSYRKIALNEQFASYKEKIAQLEEQKAFEEKRAEEIKEYEEYVQSKKYIEKEAREKLGLVYPNEVVFQPEK